MPTPGPQRGGSDEGSHHRTGSHDGEHSSNDGQLSLSCISSDSHPSTPYSTTSEESYGEEQEQRRQQRQRSTARRISKASSKARGSKKTSRNARVNGPRRTQLPLREVVASRAFECRIGARGELSKVLDVDTEIRDTSPEIGGDDSHQVEPSTPMEPGSEKRKHQNHLHHHQRQALDRRPPGSGFRVEPVLFGADIDVGPQSSLDILWGMDLHWCDLESLVGIPDELGDSPWDSDDDSSDNDEEKSWLCVYLDASLNRLRGFDAIAGQLSLRKLAYLDVSCNLIEDLDAVQDLVNLQVLMAKNNQIDSIEALGGVPKGSNLRHVDLSNNSISVVEAPQSTHAFRRMKSLNLASNHLEYFEEDVALALPSLERLDVSGALKDTTNWSL